MGFLDGMIKLQLSSMEVVHRYLMGVQNIPHCTQGEGGLLEPLSQLFKRFRLRGPIHMTMCTHSINLKEVKLVIYKQETNQTLYLSMGAGRMIQGTFQIIKTNLDAGGGRGRHCVKIRNEARKEELRIGKRTTIIWAYKKK